MNETFIFFKIVHLVFNTLISASFLLVDMLKNIKTEAVFTKRQKWTMNETFFFFKIVHLVFNTLIPASFLLVDMLKKYEDWSCIYQETEMNNEWNILFLQNSPLGIQYTYSSKFSIGWYVKKILRLKLYLPRDRNEQWMKH